MEDKPPIGLMPEWLHNERRYSEINKAIERYNAENIEVPHEWIDEQLKLYSKVLSYRQSKQQSVENKDWEMVDGFKKCIDGFWTGEVILRMPKRKK